MKAMVYAKSCIQCGLCVSVCPEVFSLLPGQTAGRGHPHRFAAERAGGGGGVPYGCHFPAIICGKNLIFSKIRLYKTQ